MTQGFLSLPLTAALAASMSLASSAPATSLQDGGVDAPQADDWVRHEPEFRRIAKELLESDDPYVGNREIKRLEALLADPATPPGRRRTAKIKLARQILKWNEIDRAIEYLEESREALHGNQEKETKLLRHLAIAYLRKAETENCVIRHNSECCIFPLEGGALHDEREPAEKARVVYEELLRRRPDDLESRWLLNLIAMALGDHPAAVPEHLRIAPERFASEGEVERFRDIATQMGVDTFNLCGGALVDDFDGDGYFDILTSSFDQSEPLHYYHNTGDGQFEDRSDASHASDQLGGLNLVAGDYDNDGDPDVLVLRGAWLRHNGLVRNSLLRNDGGVFVDVTHRAGIADPRPTQSAAFGDFNGDGLLDLFVANESLVKFDGTCDYPDQLYINQGNGTFVDTATDAGIEGDRYSKGVTAGDYDNDGDLDLYISNLGPNQLFQNQGEGTFIDVAAKAGVVEPTSRSIPCWFFDYDNDGWLDIFAGTYDATMADVASEVLGMKQSSDPVRLYHNQRNGKFKDVAAEMGIPRALKPMGANFGDFDYDGWLDFYLGTGEPMLQSLMPNVMMRNAGGERFLNVTTSGGFGHLQKGHTVAFADLDQDGDQDIYHQLGGFFPVDRYANVLFENPGNGNRWIYLDIVGTKTNRAGVGARLRLVLETPTGERELHRAVGVVSSFGGSPRRQEIGLGDAEKITRIEIHWPVSGTTQVFEDVPLNALYRLTEGEDELEPLELRPFQFQVGER